MTIAGLRVGFDQRTITRLSEQIARAQRGATRPIAKKAARLMEIEVVKVVDEQDFKYAIPRVGSTNTKRMKTRDSYAAKAIQTPEGWRAFITIKRGADPGKIKALEYGGEAHTTRVKNKKWLTGWAWDGSQYTSNPAQQIFTKEVQTPAFPGRFIMRKARDRVYQRIRRGTV